MADDKPTDEPRDPSRGAPDTGGREPGAPVPKDAIDPELIKLARTRTPIGVITAAGVVFLCGLFLVRLHGDRRFGGSDAPRPTTVADVVAGKVAADSYVSLEAEAQVAHAIRASRSETGVGNRVVPVRGGQDKVWLVLPGDGWSPPSLTGHVGRLRRLADLPIADAVRAHAAATQRPVFAAAAAVRAGLATGTVTTVSGDAVTVAASDRVAFDVIDPDAALIVATLNERLPDAAAWQRALTAAGITATGPIAPPPGAAVNRVRFEVKAPGALADTTSKLDAATLYAARLEPITRHLETTWGALAGSSAAGFTVGAATVPDAQVDLVGIYQRRPIPDGAFALITGEKPADYWHVMPVTVGLAVIGLLFLWALVRAVRRDLLPPRA